MTKHINGMGGAVGAVGAVVAALGLAVGCGDGFASGDCHASRTCSAAGDGGHGGADDVDPADPVAGGGGGGDASMVGGMAGVAGAADGVAGGAGGAGAEAECRVDADCSNSDPVDGEEACDDGVCVAGNPPPTIVSFTPESDAAEVEPDTKIVIEFSEPLDPETVTSTSVQVLDGTTAVPGKLVYAGTKVTFTPSEPLALLAHHTLSVSTEVTDEDGAPLLDELSSTFQVRDGAWKTIDVVEGQQLYELSDELPMTSTGRALLSWTGNAGSPCPVTAGWFLRGETRALKTFLTDENSDCDHVSAGGNAAGVAGLVWFVPASNKGVTVEQYRADAWLPMPALVSKSGAHTFRLAVAPSGAATLFDQEDSTYEAGNVVAWTTNAAGEWPEVGTLLSEYMPEGKASVAFDPGGKGLAVWRAQDKAEPKLERIVASRLATESGKWAAAVDLPGSVTANADPRQLGLPVVALDSQGKGLALWVDGPSGKLMSSRFVQPTWAQPVSISGALVVDVLEESPALVFDGEAFVAAWTAQEAGKHYAYTARYDLATGWGTYLKQQTAADSASTPRMPRLVSDGRGNLLLVYASGSDDDFTLHYQRYTGNAWSGISLVPDGYMSALGFDVRYYYPLALSMSHNGLAALAWADHDAQGYIASIHLASFF